MKGSNKIIVVVVLALVVLFGVGQFFTSNNLSSVSSSSTASGTTQVVAAPAATAVIAYIPPQPTSSTLVESGSCWTNSIAAPFRADAWRCAVGNGINDPCFQIPNDTSSLLCGINPTVPNATSTFVLKLTKPLPTAQIPPQGSAPADWAWLIQLGDGTLCTPFTGTLPAMAGNDFASYSCAPGPLGNDLLIFNNFNTSSSVWTAEVGTLSQGTSAEQTIATSSTVPIETIWE
jgi:hypothetical protein